MIVFLAEVDFKMRLPKELLDVRLGGGKCFHFLKKSKFIMFL